MRCLPDLLFCEKDLHLVLEENLQTASQEVDNIPEEQFHHSSDEEILEHVFSKVQIISLELHEDAKQMEKLETEVDVSKDPNRWIDDPSRPCLVPGIQIVVSVPFSGDSLLWRCKPSTHNYNPSQGRIITERGNPMGGLLELNMFKPADSVGDGSEFKNENERTLTSIRTYLGWQGNDLENHIHKLRKQIVQSVANRRKRLGDLELIAKTLAIPLKRDPNSPDISSLPIKRRLVKPLPLVRAEPPEPGIRDEDYNHILGVIRHEGRSFEATPKTFAVHDEESLRDIILAHLNGHYEGGATGETFRQHGKTDIRIEDSSRSAFIGECKVWHGAKSLSDAVDQLLGYLTWRDCKAALILLNKDNAGFSAIQDQVPEILAKHPKCIRLMEVKHPGEWRFHFSSADDVERQITIHVFLFNLYVAPEM